MRISVVLVLLMTLCGFAAAADDVPEPGIRRFGSTALRHALPVTGVAFDGERARLISTSFDGRVLGWDTATGELLETLHEGSPISRLSRSADVRVLGLSRASGEAATILDRRGEGITTRDLAGDQVVVSQDGSLAATWSSGTHEITVVDTASGDERGRWMVGAEGVLYWVAFSDDASKIVIVGRFGTSRRDLHTRIAVHPLAGGPPTTHETDGSPTAFAFSEEDGVGVVHLGFADGRLVRRSLNDEEPIAWQADTAPIASIRPLGHARVLTGGGSGSIALWERAEGEWSETWRVAAHLGRVSSLGFDASRGWLASGGEDHTISLRDLVSGAALFVPVRHSGRITAAALSADGNTAVTGAWNGVFGLWSLRDGEVVSSFHESGAGTLNGVALLADDRVVATGGREGRLALWDRTRDTTRVFEEQLGSTVTALVAGSSGRKLASGEGDGVVRVWQLVDGDALENATTFMAPRNASVGALAWSPDEGQLALGAMSMLAVVDLASGRALYEVDMKSPVTALSWSADGRRLAVGLAARAAVVLDTESWETIARVPSQGGRVQAVALSEDGARIAVASVSGVEVLVHSVDGEGAPRSLGGHSGAVTGLVWRGDQLLTASADGTAVLWAP